MDRAIMSGRAPAVTRNLTCAPPLAERLRSNAVLLRMIGRQEVPLRRTDLLALAEDMVAWARELEAAR